MARVSRGVTAHAKHKKIIKRAKGYYGRRKNVFRVAFDIKFLFRRIFLRILNGSKNIFDDF